jgi:hypothetical protein
MSLYMYEAAYTGKSWAAQMKNPENRVEAVGRQACGAVGGKLIGGSSELLTESFGSGG